MKIVTKREFEEYPEGTIFAEYRPSTLASSLMRKLDNNFGAVDIIPIEGENFCWDWSIHDYDNSQLFVVFDNIDILLMIQNLTTGLDLEGELKYE